MAFEITEAEVREMRALALEMGRLSPSLHTALHEFETAGRVSERMYNRFRTQAIFVVGIENGTRGMHTPSKDLRIRLGGWLAAEEAKKGEALSVRYTMRVTETWDVNTKIAAARVGMTVSEFVRQATEEKADGILKPNKSLTDLQEAAA